MRQHEHDVLGRRRYSPRLIQARAAEIVTELTQAFEFSPTQRLAVHEAARCIAILEAIDRDLDQRGLVDKEGKPRYLLKPQLADLSPARAVAGEGLGGDRAEGDERAAPSRADFPDYVRALQRIALGHDATATARDQLAALEELLELGPKGTTSYLERPAEFELTRRWHAIHEAKRATAGSWRCARAWLRRR